MLPVLSLSNAELVESFNRLHHRETTLMVLLLEHLAEIEKRELHLADGYSSMFEYLQKKYHYSASATWRRLTSARALSKFPQLRNLLETGELNLSTLSRVAQSLTTENAAEVIEMVRGKSEKEVEKILLTLDLKVPGGSRISKKQLEKERVRMVAVVEDKIPAEANKTIALDLFSESGDRVSPDGHTQPLFTAGLEQSEADIPCDNSESQSAVEIAYRIELGIDEELKAKIERIRLKLSARYPQGASYRELIETLADYYLKREDKENRITASDTSEIISHLETDTPEAEEEAEEEEEKEEANLYPKLLDDEPVSACPTSRYIPKAVARRVKDRDGHCCSFIGNDGKRCGSTWDLEIDHIVPFACGGTHAENNLRLLCRAHNNYYAEQIFGKEFIKMKRSDHFRTGSKLKR